MKHLILLFSALLLSQVSVANTIMQDDYGMIKAKAKELTTKYNAELGMEANQLEEFGQTVASYMIKKAKANKLNLAESDKTVMLKQLDMQENEDMAALLSKGQYKKYIKAKTKLQP